MVIRYPARHTCLFDMSDSQGLSTVTVQVLA